MLSESGESGNGRNSNRARPLPTITACQWLGVRVRGGRCPYHGGDSCLVVFIHPERLPSTFADAALSGIYGWRDEPPVPAVDVRAKLGLDDG